MASSPLIVFLGLSILLSFSSSSVLAADKTTHTYIVFTDVSKKPSSFQTPSEWYTAIIGSAINRTDNVNEIKSRIGYIYNFFHGFSVSLSPGEAEKVGEMPGVIGVQRDRIYNYNLNEKETLEDSQHKYSGASGELIERFLSAPRSSLANFGHAQAPSNVLVGNSAAATSSPSRFAATGHQGHHQSASVPPVSVPVSHFMASSPSPAASGGSSSVFRESRLTSSSRLT